MKANLFPEPERWSERAAGPGGASAEDVIGASFQQIRTATEPSDAVALRWARRAMVTPSRASHGRLWSLAVAAVILAGGGAVGARVAWRAAVTSGRTPAPPDEPTPAVRTARHASVRREAPPPPPEVLPDPEIAPDLPHPPTPLPAAPKTARAAGPAPASRPLTDPPPVVASDAPEEARLVARAFRHLRDEGDAAAALAVLDERQRQFGPGALASEAALARAEALLLLGRTDDALPILLGLRDPLAGMTPDVRAARAELLARAKRCAEAIADFDALLAPGAPALTRERALYGRAACRLQGHGADAIPDLESYLRDYPHGRFAPAVRDALEKLRHP